MIYDCTSQINFSRISTGYHNRLQTCKNCTMLARVLAFLQDEVIVIFIKVQLIHVFLDIAAVKLTSKQNVQHV